MVQDHNSFCSCLAYFAVCKVHKQYCVAAAEIMRVHVLHYRLKCQTIFNKPKTTQANAVSKPRLPNDSKRTPGGLIQEVTKVHRMSSKELQASHIWNKNNTTFNKKNVTTTVKHGGGSVMVLLLLCHVRTWTTCCD